MRQYNVISVTSDNNPRICTAFSKNCAAVQFNPNRGFNCIRVIYNNGTSEIAEDFHVKSTYRYSHVPCEHGIANCGDHAIINLSGERIILDIEKDTITFVS